MSDEEDEMIAKLSDYLDGALSAGEREAVAKKIADDPTWKQTHDEMADTRNKLSGMQKQRASPSFAADVTSTIHKRSAGRFFGRRTFGDRVPFTALVVIAVMGMVVVAYILWASQTGSLAVRPEATPHAPAPEVAPKP